MSLYHVYKSRFDSIFSLAQHNEKFYNAAEAQACADFMLNYYDIGEYVRVTFLTKELELNSYVARVTGKNIFAQSMEPVFYLLEDNATTGKVAPGSLMEKLTDEEKTAIEQG